MYTFRYVLKDEPCSDTEYDPDDDTVQVYHTVAAAPVPGSPDCTPALTLEPIATEPTASGAALYSTQATHVKPAV